MLRFSTILMMVVLLVHALAGCCWHHDHSLQTETIASTAAICCHDHQPAGSEDSSEAPTEEGCDGARCSFVSIANAPCPAPFDSPAAYAVQTGMLLTPSFAATPTLDFVDSGPQVRRHLILSVLLI